MKKVTIAGLACASLCLTPTIANANKLNKKDKDLLVGLASILIGGVLSDKQQSQTKQDQQKQQQQTIIDNQEKEKFVRQIYENTLGLSLEQRIEKDIRATTYDREFQVNTYQLNTLATLSPKYMSRALQSADYTLFKYKQTHFINPADTLDNCSELGFDLFWGFQDNIPHYPEHKIDYIAQADGTVKVVAKLYDAHSGSYSIQDINYHLVKEDGQYKVDDIGYYSHTYQVQLNSVKREILTHCT